MNSIWVVESGSYSDYRVVGVFTTRDNAERVARAINEAAEREGGYDKATIDEWPLDPGVDELNAGRTMFDVYMHEDGTVEECDPIERRWSKFKTERIKSIETSREAR